MAALIQRTFKSSLVCFSSTKDNIKMIVLTMFACRHSISHQVQFKNCSIEYDCLFEGKYAYFVLIPLSLTSTFVCLNIVEIAVIASNKKKAPRKAEKRTFL